MFHEGDLQSGITTAISQQRTVACFVRDSGEESTIWEQQWLADPLVSNPLSSKAVVLRIEAGSQEAGFLAAFCPVSKAPSLILIHNGQLKDNITAGTQKDDFVRKVRAALGEEEQDGDTGAPSSTSNKPSTSGQHWQVDSEEQEALDLQLASGSHASEPQQTQSARSSDPQPPPPAPPDSSHPPSYSTANLQSTFPDRQAHLDATHQQQVDAEKAKVAAAKARREATPGKPRTAQDDYAAQRRRQLAEEKRAKERILAQIEADKVARKQREKERKEAETATMSQLAQEETLPANPQRPMRRSGAAASANIQVRLFSGTTLRQSFPATATLGEDIRAWVDAAAAEDVQQARPPPYLFKHILNPLPSRTIEVGEEDHSLTDLEMLPSATLALVPVQGTTVDAFGAGGANGVLGYAYSIATGAAGMVGSTITRVASGISSTVWSGGTSTGNTAEDATAQRARDARTPQTPLDGANESAAEGASTGRSSARVRTLADGRVEASRKGKGKDPETWYNGNQTSYQPKDDPSQGSEDG